MVNYILQLVPLLLVIGWSIWYVIHTKRRMRAVLGADQPAAADATETAEQGAAAGASSADGVSPGKDAGSLPMVHLPCSKHGAGAASSGHKGEAPDVQVDMRGSSSSTSSTRLLPGVLGEAGAGSSKSSSGAPPGSPSIAGLKKRGASGHGEEA